MIYIDPLRRTELVWDDAGLKTKEDNSLVYPRKQGAVRLVMDTNYTDNFGFQWNKFRTTQIDRDVKSAAQSRDRFFAVTGWDREDLKGKNILEVGSGAGRFSQIVLDHTPANLYSVDYSNAVEANYKNNGHHGDRFKLFQASVYELPFAEGQFDKVFCFGVLQHTPDVRKSVECLARMVKPGGELVVDFYPVTGWWTKVHAKYLFRPFTKRTSHEKLLARIERNVDWMIAASRFFDKIGVGRITNRFIPICDIKSTLPARLSPQQLREWCILDTFDMFSPEYDQPQRIATVRKWFQQSAFRDIFADYINYSGNNRVAVVKGAKTIMIQ